MRLRAIMEAVFNYFREKWLVFARAVEIGYLETTGQKITPRQFWRGMFFISRVFFYGVFLGFAAGYVIFSL